MSGQTHSAPGPARRNRWPSTISQSPSASSQAILPPQESSSSYFATRMIFPENAGHFETSGTGQADFRDIETLGQWPSPSPPLTQGPLASGSHMPHGTLPSNGTHHSIGSAIHPAILPTTDPSRTLMCSCAFDTPSACYVHCPLETLYSAYKALPHRDPLALQLLARVFTDPQRNYPPEIAPTEPPPANKLCLERIGIPNPCCCNSGQLSQMKHPTRHLQSNTHIREYSFEVQDTFEFEYCGNFHLCPNGYFVGRPGQVDARHRKTKKGDEYSTCRAMRPVVIKGLPKAVTFPGFGTILYLPGETVPAAYADRWRFFTLSDQDEKAKCSDKKHAGTSSYNDWKTIREADLPPELRSENMTARPSSQGTAPAENSPVVFSPFTPHIGEDLVALYTSASSPPLVLPSADMPSGALSHTVPVPQVFSLHITLYIVNDSIASAWQLSYLHCSWIRNAEIPL
ncbi:uncharacterized protein STEHIDRAFT_109649 [Stereum hirsutum FP-91666 SS1]|uniref:uncharacterized protein n=1 Tax=Stereum hirsutum (strain FP-91666) TaxID=721885 RepID=UPI0004409E5B|nr:uncharacterized protein STEHIDRAFT_109649 [Stereum hirsutum FP-91666 SS1]EIM87765.1 hypothetical protein STEHIDRAFT_109649 [Stereum hirsutum FP-91666 SS1]